MQTPTDKLRSFIEKADALAQVRDKPERVRSFIQLATESLTRTEFNESFARVVNLMRAAITDLNASLRAQFASLEQQLSARIEQRLSLVKDGKDGMDALPVDEAALEERLAARIRTPKSGETPIINTEEIAQKVFSRVRIPKDGSPDTADDIRNKLELLTGKERLKIDAIHGLREHVDLVSKHAYSGGGGSVLKVMNNGAITVQATQALNLKGAGAPTISVGQNGVTDLTFGVGGFTQLTATGVIDGSNTVFSFTSKPSFVVMDGVWMTENNGWTWNATTLKATMSVPPQSGVFGFLFTTGALTKLTATGVVNGSNAAFVFTNKPQYVVSDGLWFVENSGWTWNAATLTATMSVPPQTGIFAFT